VKIELSEFSAKLYRDAAPLLVTAPVPCCGAGFVQRLVNASSAMVVYDANPLLAETLPALAVGELARLHAESERIETARDAYVATGMPTGPLHPEPGALSAGVFDAFHAIVDRYEADALGLGRRAWGLKHLPADLSAIGHFIRLLPRARVLFVSRGLEDALASAKAHGLVDGAAATEAYARRWAANMEAAAGLAEQRWFMSVSHETSVADPAAFAARIESFVGAGRIDPAVLDGAALDGPAPALAPEDQRMLAGLGLGRRPARPARLGLS
jgi:hypothetical protein